MRFAGVPVSACIERHDLASGVRKRRHYPRKNPVDIGIGNKPVMQYHGWQFASSSPCPVSNLDAIKRNESVHPVCPFSRCITDSKLPLSYHMTVCFALSWWISEEEVR